MNKVRKKLFEEYLFEFGIDGSLLGQIVDTVLDQEKRIIKLEKKK